METEPRRCREEDCDRPAVEGDARCVLHRGRLGPMRVVEALALPEEARAPEPALVVEVLPPEAAPGREWGRGLADSLGWVVAFWGTVALALVGAPLLAAEGSTVVLAALGAAGLSGAFFLWRAPRSAWKAWSASRGWRRAVAGAVLGASFFPLSLAAVGVLAVVLGLLG